MTAEEAYERFRYDIAHDVFAVRSLGFLKDLPLSGSSSSQESLWPTPNVFLGPEKTPMSKVQALFSTDASHPRPKKTEYLSNEIRLIDKPGNTPRWREKIFIAIWECMRNAGLKGNPSALLQKITLRGLSLLGPGDSKRFDSSKHVAGSFGTLLVDLPMKYEHGLIQVTRDGQTTSHDFSKGGGRFNAFLHWFQDCTVTIEPITSGSRALLYYDVRVDHMAGYPLTLYPPERFLTPQSCLKSLEAHVETVVSEQTFRDLPSKERFLPLVRLLLETYHEEKKMKVPPVVLELCALVARSFEAKVKGAISGDVVLYGLPDIPREYVELIWSLGGKEEAQRILTEDYVNSLEELVAKMDEEDSDEVQFHEDQ